MLIDAPAHPRFAEADSLLGESDISDQVAYSIREFNSATRGSEITSAFLVIFTIWRIERRLGHQMWFHQTWGGETLGGDLLLTWRLQVLRPAAITVNASNSHIGNSRWHRPPRLRLPCLHKQ